MDVGPSRRCSGASCLPVMRRLRRKQHVARDVSNHAISRLAWGLSVLAGRAALAISEAFRLRAFAAPLQEALRCDASRRSGARRLAKRLARGSAPVACGYEPQVKTPDSRFGTVPTNRISILHRSIQSGSKLYRSELRYRAGRTNLEPPFPAHERFQKV